MKRSLSSTLLSAIIILALLATSSSALAPPPRALAQDPDGDTAQNVFREMTVEDRVGQLFVVGFIGDDPVPNSAIAELIRDYRIGGVVLLASNGNFRNLAPDGTPAQTPEQIVRLVNRLQALAFDGNLPFSAALAPTRENVRRLATPADRGVTLPLFVAIDHEGDGFPFTRLFSGFTPLPSNMALGATWSSGDAARVGAIVGQELAAVGVNLLLGPSLDVLYAPRPDPRVSLGVRSFGGSPDWVGRLGRAYVAGVHEGSNGKVATVAKHFPGQGGSDRLPDSEVATIQKTREELQAVEIAPFAAIVRSSRFVAVEEDAPSPSVVTDALLSTHARYVGLQGSSEGAPPISLDPQLEQSLLSMAPFNSWRRNQQGLVMSDSLGAQAIRLYYDPSLQEFPYRTVAQRALLAGNDLLTLSQFAATDVWEDQLANIKETILFFRAQYEADPEFRRRVDAAVIRILNLKARLYPDLDLVGSLVDGSDVAERVGQNSAAVAQVARSAITLISPSQAEFNERLPTGPDADDEMLIFTDSRSGRECFSDDCPAFPLIQPTALEDIIVRLYGPTASGQISPGRIHSLTFDQLSSYLVGQSIDLPVQEIDRLIEQSNWLVFAILDENPNYPASSALRQFLNQRPTSRENKRIVVIAYNAPHFLDATDIAKLTAYFAAYAKTAPFLEASMRALFREFTPTGVSPVDISGINYTLADKLRPNPEQTITLRLPDVDVQIGANTFTAQVGQTLRVVAGPILDYNNHLAPDGTPVNFKLRHSGDPFELALGEPGAVDGYAEASVVLDRPGDFEVRAQSGQAVGSLSLIVTIGDEGRAQVAVSTATPTPAPTSTPTPTATPSPLPTATPTPSPPAAPASVTPPLRRVDPGAFGLALAAILLVVVIGFFLLGATAQIPERAVRNLLLIVLGGLVAYSLYGLGMLPGATQMQRQWRPWGAGAAAAIGSLLSLLLIWLQQERRRT